MDITKPNTSNSRPTNNFLSNTGSAISRTVRGFRPRSGTADEASRPRGRANTVSGQRPQVRKQKASTTSQGEPAKLVSSGSQEDAKEGQLTDKEFTAFLASCKEDDGMGKKLPTIFKYTGNAKEVYVCGKSTHD